MNTTAPAPTRAFRRVLPALLPGLLLLSAAAHGQFRIQSHSIDGGGRQSQGSRFAVEGTIGQPDTARLAGKRFSLQGGFWPPGAPIPPRPAAIFSHGFEDPAP